MFNSVALRTLAILHGLLGRSQDEEGQTLAEYSLIISTIAVATIIISVIAFREALIGAWNSASQCLTGSC
jgi:Flp pilus assembly pilin Flp